MWGLICLCLLLEGCAVTIVCDGEFRHHTKRSTTKRTADHHRNSLEFHYLKCKLSSVSKSLRNGNISMEEKNNLQNERDILVKQTRKLEKQFANTKINVGDELFLKINEEINKLTLLYPLIDINTNLKVIQAEFQADSVIAYQSVQMISSFVTTATNPYILVTIVVVFSILSILRNRTKGQ